MAPRKKTITVNPYFFCAVIVCTIAAVCSFGGIIVVNYWPGPNEARANEIVDIFGKLLLTVIGAFIGLLGGRAGVPDETK